MRFCASNRERVSFLDFSANINPLGLANEVKAAIEDNIGQVIPLPGPGGSRLKTGSCHPLQIIAGYNCIGQWCGGTTVCSFFILCGRKMS